MEEFNRKLQRRAPEASYPGRVRGAPAKGFSRDELQRYLDRKAGDGHSHSVVAHLRWDLRQIFRMAVVEGCLVRNPAELLFIPRDARRFPKPRLTLEQVRLLFSVLDLRERVIAGFAILAGMRPGEIFALRRCHVEKGYADIRQRVYRGVIDTPKTFNSQRWAAVGDGLSVWLKQWLETDASSERTRRLALSIREGHNSGWKRELLEAPLPAALAGRRTPVGEFSGDASNPRHLALGIDPQVHADQMGHTVNVNQNQYTRSSLERRRTAVNALEKALAME